MTVLSASDLGWQAPARWLSLRNTSLNHLSGTLSCAKLGAPECMIEQELCCSPQTMLAPPEAQGNRLPLMAHLCMFPYAEETMSDSKGAAEIRM